MKSEQRYLLGDDDRAAERLRLLSDLFDPRELDDLERELGAIASSGNGVVHYGLGEIVLERR